MCSFVYCVWISFLSLLSFVRQHTHTHNMCLYWCVSTRCTRVRFACEHQLKLRCLACLHEQFAMWMGTWSHGFLAKFHFESNSIERYFLTIQFYYRTSSTQWCTQIFSERTLSTFTTYTDGHKNSNQIITSTKEHSNMWTSIQLKCNFGHLTVSTPFHFWNDVCGAIGMDAIIRLFFCYAEETGVMM